MGRLISLIFCFLSWVVAGPAAAQDSDDQARAQVHFEAGLAHYENGDYREAVTEFDRAYAVTPVPEILYNLYQSHQRLGNLEEAAAFLERYLADASEVEDRARLETRLANLREEADAQRTEAEAEAAAEAEATAERQRAEEERARAEEEAAAARAEAAEERRKSDTARGTRTTAAIIGFVVGGVGLATFGVFAALAAAEDASIADGCGAFRTCTSDDLGALETFSLVADIALGVGAAGVLVGTIFALTLLGGDDDQERAAALRLAPWVGGGVLGATAGGAF